MGRYKSKSNSSQDLGTLEGLSTYARTRGLGRQAEEIVNPKPKLSTLQRLGTGLSSLNPAEAILTGQEQGFDTGVKTYFTGAARSIGSALTGTDYNPNRRMFKDVVEKMGVENGIAKFGLGFAGDILLDPSTYFGGAIAKGITKVAAKGAGGVLKSVGKFAPETETGLRLAGTGLKDAFGRAFKFGYKSSKGATDDVMSFLSREQQAKLGLAQSNLDRLGTGVLTPDQQQELALKLIAGKRAEFAQRELSQGLKDSAEYFTPFKDKLDGMIIRREKSLASLQSEITRLEDKGLEYLGKTTNTQDFANDLIKMPGDRYDKLVAKIGRKVATREGWQSDMFDELGKLRKEYAQLDELQKGEQAMAEKVFAQKGEVAREVAKSADPIVQKAIEEQTARSQKFASQLGMENPYETYFPFIKKEKLDTFIKEAASSNLRVGSEGYAKQFRNLLTNDAIETNPAKAFFTSEAQQVTNRMTRDFLQGFVKKYGKGLDEFANADEALKAGYKVIKEKGFLGKEIGYLNQWDAGLIRDSISPEFQTINMLAKATGFDAITSLFKRSVTGLFAPFHVRNYMSGHIQNFEVLGVDALNPKNISIGQKIAFNMAKGKEMPSGMITLGKKTMKFKDMMKPFVNRFSGDTFYTADFDTALKAGGELKSAAKIFSKERLGTTVKTLGLGQEAIPFKVGRSIGQFIEHSQKATAYVTALSQGKTIQEALELATRAGFDYRQLTRFESQIMRRIVPFYSFARKNVELQLRTLGENPERINQVLRFFGNIGETLTDEEKKNLPAFIQESIGVKLEDTPEGLKQYISSFGTPIEAFTQLFGSNPVLRTISQMNPILKAPIEIGIGKDSFRQRDLKDVYDAKEYKMAPQIIKDLLDITEVDKPILKKGGDGKLVQVGTKKQYVADPVRLLIARSLFTSRGVSYLDQVFGNDLQGFVKYLKTLTGIKPQQIDLQMQESINNTNKKRELEDLLVKRGGLNTYSRVYKPKN